MKKYINYKYFIRTILVLFFGLFMHTSDNAFAQEQKTQRGTQISDNTAPNTLSPLEFSLLELNSTERGFLMPRMTTAERDNIPTANLAAGLTIYNTSMGCVEFYNVTRQVWMNMCGDVEPAIFTIPSDKCGKIEKNITGDYIQGVLLNERSNLITIEVSVSTPGTFEIEAIAYDDMGNENGYTFITKGVFPTSGNFMLVLKGNGTPKKGYANTNTKDTIKFWLNKKKATCEVRNHVKPDFEPLLAIFDCSNPVGVEGVYKEKEPLTTANRLIASVKVTKPGRGKVYGEIPISGAQTEVIKYESETIDFRVTDVNQVQTVILSPVYGTGKPTTGGELTGKLKLISKGKYEYDPFAPEDILTIQGCDFKISVASDGPKYSIGSVELLSTFKVQLGVKDKNGQDVQYGRPYITPKTNMGGNGSTDFMARVHIAPKAAGQYVIKSNKNNGIWFEGTGDITDADVKAGYKAIDLRAFGKSESDLPNAYGRFDFTGNNLDPELTNTGAMFVDFVYRPMTMYSIGGGSDQAWHPGGRNDHREWSAGPRIIRQYKHFSWDGVVRIASLNIIDVADFTAEVRGVDNSSQMTSATSTNISNFQTNLVNSDMVFIGGNSTSNNFNKNSAQLQALATAVRSTKTALVYGEGQAKFMNEFLGLLGNGGSTTDLSSVGPFDVVSSIQSESKLILGVSNAYFSKGDAPSGLASLKIASHRTSSTTVTNLAGNDYYITLAGSDGAAFAFVHKTYGFVGVGSSGFMGGWFDTARPGTNSYPVSGRADGTPLARVYSGGNVYNSFFLLNLVHWAIDYAQENQPNKVK
ncbi:MAG: hypothetical protein LBI73_10145 [Myroides sp.]|jgi:hypothetical protein|nr:hypothetical protein [Myroides sp.]